MYSRRVLLGTLGMRTRPLLLRIQIMARGKFSGTFEELTEGQGEIALVLEYNSIDESVTIISATELGKDFSKEDKEIQNRKLAFQYVLARDLPEDLSGKVEMEQRRMRRAHTKIPGFSMGDLLGEAEEEEEVSVMKEGIVTRKGV